MTGGNSLPHFDPGSSILIDNALTSPDAAKPAFDLLSHLTPDSIVAVTYNQSADTFLRQWRSQVGTIPKFARVITVGRSMRSSATQLSQQNIVRPVKRLDDLTGVQSAVASALDNATDKTVLIFDSLTTPLTHVSPTEMISFFSFLSNHLTDTEAVGYFHITTRVSDATTVASIQSLADAIVERDEDDWLVRPSVEWISESLSADLLFDVLRSRQRREVLRYLLRATEPVSLDELTTTIAKRESGKQTINRNEYRRYYMSLSQKHLPRLDDVGFIEYDSPTSRILISKAAQHIEPFLTLAEELSER
ncbi:DUF7504 family protein [Haladaptatus halobius]|uniref:DUF7504 family protein n=1 Tax=Haladaptatus halobius TaxID=2884875 RepID=UPI001D0A050F|nr:hypothetical protein [Haladaptatus halobius]